MNKILTIIFKFYFELIAGSNAEENAGIANCRAHDMRHTFATLAAAQGAPNLELATAMGHRTLQMLQGYTHLDVQITKRFSKNIKEIIESINTWLKVNTSLCIPIEEHKVVKNVYLALGPSRRYKTRLIDLPASPPRAIEDSEDHLFEPLHFNMMSKKWEAQYEHDKIYYAVDPISSYLLISISASAQRRRLPFAS